MDMLQECLLLIPTGHSGEFNPYLALLRCEESGAHESKDSGLGTSLNCACPSNVRLSANNMLLQSE